MTFTDNEIVVMVTEACRTDVGFTSWSISTKHLQIFAEMVAAKEREACAKFADDWSGHYQANVIASNIRSRGKNERY